MAIISRETAYGAVIGGTLTAVYWGSQMFDVLGEPTHYAPEVDFITNLVRLIIFIPPVVIGTGIGAAAGALTGKLLNLSNRADNVAQEVVVKRNKHA